MYEMHLTLFLKSGCDTLTTETATTATRATTPTSQRSRSRRDGSPDPSLVTWLAGVTFNDVLDTLLRQALDRHTWSIENRCWSTRVWRSAQTTGRLLVGYTQTAGRLLAWCAVWRMVSRVWRSARSIILSLSGTEPRRPCKMPHDMRFLSHARCSVGWPTVLT
jgi:hypothetical protein